MAAPHQTRISEPANPRISAYTADFVVNAVRNTAPVALASGYASGSQAPRGGTAALMRKARRINVNAAVPAYGDIFWKASDPTRDQCSAIPPSRHNPPKRWTRTYRYPAAT